ncbi:hypothetical protein DMB68_11140 [Flavobacterium hydrophilum]|uniref:Uncharacterized protein n=2 Tax=Flavobacterium hydrophilum TaxID=2211445 RepID=A0A2V4C1R3_9FLAO|nr:hypothetical protein DMB68_11140 [Flavobacterium hydrophilum]
MFLSCSGEEESKEDSPENAKEVFELQTLQASDIRATTVLVPSSVESSIEKSVQSRGICYNTIGNPNIKDLKVQNSENMLGIYGTLLIDLQQNTKFYAKAYAVSNSGSTYYGNEISFQTSKMTIPPTEFITYDAANITFNSAILSGVIFKNGNIRWDDLKMGFCYSATNRSPNITDSIVYANSEVTEPFRVSAKNLNSKTTYYFRPFASNFSGTEIYYGDIKTFTTTNSN